MEVNVQGVREVSNERTVWILKDRCDKGREESLVMVMRLMICGVYYYYYYTIKQRWAGNVASVGGIRRVYAIVFVKPEGRNISFIRVHIAVDPTKQRGSVAVGFT